MDAIGRLAALSPRPRRSLRGRFLGAAVWGCVLGLAGLPALAAESTTALERTVKAAYLYKFLSYVDWPPNMLPPPGAPFVIGVAGSDEVLTELRSIAPDRTVAERPLDVRRVKDVESLTDLHVLFVGRGESSRLAELARAAQQRSILVVSEIDGGLRMGSVINLVIVDGRVRFEVALDAAEKSGLKLSSRLLSVAQSVRTGSR